MKESMLRSTRTEAGLGDPPTEYVNNDVEAGNLIIKQGLHFQAKEPHVFIEEMKKIIEAQLRNEDRAVCNKGPFRVKDEFQHLVLPERKWDKLTQAQRKRAIKKFLDAGVNEKYAVAEGERNCDSPAEIISPSTLGKEKCLPVPFDKCGITTVPATILQSIFVKANQLLSKDELVIPKPGATNGSFVVAGCSNNVHIVTPGKGGSLICDRSCVHRSTKLCEHTLAVANKIGKLHEFLNWYKRSGAGPKITEMALSGGPKNAGRKPSKRKKSNAKKPTVNIFKDLLEEVTQQGTDSFAQTPGEDVRQSTEGKRSNTPASQTSNTANNRPGAFVNDMQRAHPTDPTTGVVQSPVIRSQWPEAQHIELNVARGISGLQQPANLNAQSLQQYRLQAQPQPFLHQREPLPPVPLQPQPYLQSVQLLGLRQPQNVPFSMLHNQAHLQPLSPVTLKWIEGTIVSKCYGCGKNIPNPPKAPPDDLVLVCRDKRIFRNPTNGLMQVADQATNVHFHLRATCLLRKYPSYNLKDLVVPREFVNIFQQEHFFRLMDEFGWCGLN